MTWEWRLRKTKSGELDTDIRDCKVVDAANRFARKAEVELHDSNGDKTSSYQNREAVTLEVQNPIQDKFHRRFDGFVVNPVDKRQDSKLEILSHDFWLRRRNVFETYTNTDISTILNDLVTKLTPLTWEPARVNVVNDRNITRTWRGERLDEVISELASISGGNEFFGGTVRTEASTQFILGDVTETEGGGLGDDSLATLNAGTLGDVDTIGDIIFFFEPPKARRAPTQLTESNYFAQSAEFTHDQRQRVNKVTVYYNGEATNQKAITVQDLEQQEALKQELESARAPVIEVVRSFPEITNDAAARRKANKILKETDVIQTAELDATYAHDLRPGDVVRLVNEDKNVDKDFRVAELTYHWLGPPTRVKLAENSEGVIDVLVQLSDEITRVDARPVDSTVIPNETMQFDLPVEIGQTVEIVKRSIPDDMFILGEVKGGLGDPTLSSISGGKLGDQRGDEEVVISG